MNKHTATAQQFIGRVGNSSTKPSARGVNLLGWEEEEHLTDQQKREALLTAVLGLQARLSEAKGAERKEMGKQISDMNLQIAALKGGNRYNGKTLQSFILDVVKERVPRLEWQRYVKEAERRQKDAEAAQEAGRVE